MILRLAGSLLALALAFAPLSLQDRAADYRAKFERETNVVHKAKQMRKLGRAEFENIEKEMSAGNSNAALAGLRQYLAQARLCEAGLDARGVNAENHPSGFKELQFSLRDSLLRLDNILASLPGSEQGPFLSVRKDLDAINRHVIRELFPRQPASADPKSGKKH